jgi:hypothetical protein
MIARALRILVDGLIDYSGFAPPAALPMEQAVRNYSAYSGGEYAWMLGRSIVPLTRVTEYATALTQLAGPETRIPWRLSALTTGDPAADVEMVEAFNSRNEGRARIDVLELKADSVEAIRQFRPTVPANLKTYVEIPLGGDLPSHISALAANGLRGKARTGGLTPEAIPSCEQVARFIVACRAARIPFKFTAGMHAPLRSVRKLTYAGDSPKAEMHGFVNAFLAAALAWQDGDLRTITQVMTETAPEAFHFDDERALWHDVRVSCEFLESARRGFAISLGSCSFTEPVEGLQQLNWL